MLIVIAGAGNVGRAIARDLIKNGHKVTVIDDDPSAIASAKKSGAITVFGDACEPDTLDEANLSKAQSSPRCRSSKSSQERMAL